MDNLNARFVYRARIRTGGTERPDHAAIVIGVRPLGVRQSIHHQIVPAGTTALSLILGKTVGLPWQPTAHARETRDNGQTNQVRIEDLRAKSP
jgi:hypothetical protein